jgi:glycosyltransferase involved in cell wall biosynthesis
MTSRGAQPATLVEPQMAPGSSSAAKQRYYHKLVQELQRFIDANLPFNVTVLVVSRGDANLLKLGDRDAWHFPQDRNRKYAGYHPADSEAAISHLEDLRSEGAAFLVFPATALWWLDYYPSFRAHMEERYRTLAAVQDQFTIFDLRRRRWRRSGNPAPSLVRRAPRQQKALYAGGRAANDEAATDSAAPAGVNPRHALLGWFDPDFYRRTNPDLFGTAGELLDHYLTRGWHDGRDPCDWFSTTFYLSRYTDIREAGLNPFLHYLTYGREEGRLPRKYRSILQARGYRPTVSAVVPNYNHAAFLADRIRSIGRQTYQPYEIILLDDASTDASRRVMEDIAGEFDIPVRCAYNSQRSGRIFSQWRKGIRLARGDLIWLCESDDFAEDTFLERLIPHFADPSVTLGFGKIQFATLSGDVDPWLDEYREQAESGRWDAPRIESAYQWFRGPFGLANVIPNVGGCLFRRQQLSARVWRAASRFSVCGDWYLYMHLARGGRIAYEPAAVSYFRQHGKNTSVASFTDSRYYQEHYRVATALRQSYGLDDTRTWMFYQRVREHYFRHFPNPDLRAFHQAFPVHRLLECQKDVRHILIGILGFQTGGAEIFPIHLANALSASGHNVSMFVLETDVENPGIRGLLRPGIPVYERAAVEDVGISEFLSTHYFAVVHSHYQGVDVWLADACREAQIPYVVTLHGSHEAAGLEPEVRGVLAKAVDHWVYTADKNLSVFDGVEIDKERLTKLSNAIPESTGQLPLARTDLAPEDGAILFGIASRALRAKGWDVAIEALEEVRRSAASPVYLALCGDGDDYDELVELYGGRDGVHFLGYQTAVGDFYRLCDCCLLPTRFAGESFPFTLIESLTVGTPIIATDIAEIKQIVAPTPKEAGGIVISPTDDDQSFKSHLLEAMTAMLDGATRKRLGQNAARLGRGYSFEELTGHYEAIYAAAIERRATP